MKTYYSCAQESLICKYESEKNKIQRNDKKKTAIAAINKA